MSITISSSIAQRRHLGTEKIVIDGNECETSLVFEAFVVLSGFGCDESIVMNHNYSKNRRPETKRPKHKVSVTAAARATEQLDGTLHLAI